jgi:hypothetical protein
MKRPTLVALSFTGGPWDGRVLESEEAPGRLRIEGSGAYHLTSWGTAHGQERARYTWRVHAEEE